MTETKALILRGILKTISFLLTSIPLIYVHSNNGSNVEPFHRGFFCDDRNLKHPFSEEQVSASLCVGSWSVAIITCVILVEVLTNGVHDFPKWPATKIPKYDNFEKIKLFPFDCFSKND